MLVSEAYRVFEHGHRRAFKSPFEAKLSKHWLTTVRLSPRKKFNHTIGWQPCVTFSYRKFKLQHWLSCIKVSVHNPVNAAHSSLHREFTYSIVWPLWVNFQWKFNCSNNWPPCVKISFESAPQRKSFRLFNSIVSQMPTQNREPVWKRAEIKS